MRRRRGGGEDEEKQHQQRAEKTTEAEERERERGVEKKTFARSETWLVIFVISRSSCLLVRCVSNHVRTNLNNRTETLWRRYLSEVNFNKDYCVLFYWMKTMVGILSQSSKRSSPPPSTSVLSSSLKTQTQPNKTPTSPPATAHPQPSYQRIIPFGVYVIIWIPEDAFRAVRF